jgi:iron complex outermembrane receptor protein
VSLSADEVINFSLNNSTLTAEEVTVSATRASKNSPTAYTNLNKKDLAKNNFGQDLPYMLNQTPSVVVSSDAGAGIGYTGIRIRGSDATRINVTINGIPYNDSESQGSYFVDLPDITSSIDNIQIQRGVGTSTNGAGAFGGSINIQTTTRRDTAYADINARRVHTVLSKPRLARVRVYWAGILAWTVACRAFIPMVISTGLRPTLNRFL